MDKQSGTDWLEDRRKGIGSSDAAAILGRDKYGKTIVDIWNEKVNGTKPEVNEFITKKGHRLEPRIRTLYELEKGMDMPSKNVFHGRYPYLKASLDGFNLKPLRVLEIKYVGEKAFADAQLGIIPEHHRIQMTHQRIVTDCPAIDYCVYSEKQDKICVLPYLPSDEECKELIIAEQAFWEKVVNKTCPDITSQDWVSVKNKKLEGMVDSYFILSDLEKKTKELRIELKEKINKLLKHPKTRVGEYKLSQTVVSGSTDYKLAIKTLLPDEDLDRFKREDRTELKLTKEKVEMAKKKNVKKKTNKKVVKRKKKNKK